jgi:hypothetical protein
MDARDAWPPPGHLSLDGFAFDDLGGFEGESGTEMRARGMRWWDNWARLDPKYTPTPYTQLAAALSKSGDPGRERSPLSWPRTRARNALRRCVALGLRGVLRAGDGAQMGSGLRNWILQFPRPLLASVLLAARRSDPVVFRAGRSPPHAGQTLVLRREPLAASARH